MSISSRIDDFDLLWDTACESFAKTTKKDLTKGANISPETVVEQIKVKKEKDEKDSVKHKHAKKVLRNSLMSIQVIGSIAAQGASTVLLLRSDVVSRIVD